MTELQRHHVDMIWNTADYQLFYQPLSFLLLFLSPTPHPSPPPPFNLLFGIRKPGTNSISLAGFCGVENGDTIYTARATNKYQSILSDKRSPLSCICYISLSDHPLPSSPLSPPLSKSKSGDYFLPEKSVIFPAFLLLLCSFLNWTTTNLVGLANQPILLAVFDGFDVAFDVFYCFILIKKMSCESCKYTDIFHVKQLAHFLQNILAD